MKSDLVLRIILGGVAVLMVPTVSAFYLDEEVKLSAAAQDKNKNSKSGGNEAGGTMPSAVPPRRVNSLPALQNAVEDKGGRGDESSGFGAQVIARVIGPGDNINFLFSFSGIKTTFTALQNMRPYTIMAAQYGSVRVSGSTTCTYPRWPCTVTETCTYDGFGLHSGSLPNDPALILELWDQGDGTVRYRFNICMPDMDYLQTCKSTYAGPPDQCNRGGSYSNMRSLIGIQIGSHPPLDKVYASGAVQHGHYLLSVSDFTAHTIDKGDECIADYDIYPLKPHSPHCPAWVHVSWNILLEEVEVEIDKCDDGWRPEKDGDPVAIQARIVKPEGAGGIFRFTLSDISNEPGYCMNDGDEDEADLEFIWEPDRFEPPEYQEADAGPPDEVMETREVVASATVKIQPKDYGGYAVLMAEVNFCGIWYPAKVKGEDEYSITVPLDDNNNHIADGFQKWDRGGAPGDDDDDFIPGGDGFDGDGFSNYEEYRGFMVKEGDKKKWLSTDPKTKDLFIYFGEPSLSWGYFGVTRLALHEIYEDGFFDTKERVVNYNHRTHHVVDQHGIYMKTGYADGKLASCYPRNAPLPWTPKSFDYVIIDTSLHKSTEELLLTEAHELGHCVNILHHGDGNKKLPVSQFLKDPRYYEAFKDMDPNAVINVALYNQQNSGNESCFMRYDYASFYMRNDGQMYVYPEWDSVSGHLCSSVEGTGVNKEGPADQRVYDGIIMVFPMCGDASRGKCTKQIRVNDKE
jgi:hypothetical protein